MSIRTEKIGSIWHGYLDGDPAIDERGLTEEIAREKVRRIFKQRRLAEEDSFERGPDALQDCS